MKVNNLTPHKLKEAGLSTFDYGNIKKGEDTTVNFLLEDLDVIYARASHCGCFSVNANSEKNGILLTVRYNSNLLGSFNKPITVYYTQNGQLLNNKITIKGNVKS